MAVALVISVISAQHGVLDFYVHVPERSRGISVSVGCEAENSPVMDDGRELDGTAHQEHFRFTEMPRGTTCLIDVNVLVEKVGKDGRVRQDYEQGHSAVQTGY